MEEITINLTPVIGEVEGFSRNDKNILKVRVQLPTGEIITSPHYRVELTLSRDGMVGLGTELLRAAYRSKEHYLFWHISPSIPSLASQKLGVFMHPDSCELMVTEEDLGTLEEALAIVSEE